MKKRSNKKHEIQCSTCKKEFIVSEYQKDTAKYCSRKCKDDRSAFYLKCVKCHSLFRRTEWQKGSYVGSYCSRECYNNRDDDIWVKCDGCKKKIRIYPSQEKYYKKHYCSNKCRIEFGSIGRLYKSDKQSKQYQKFVRSVRHCARYYEWRDSVWNRDSSECVKCKSRDKLMVHHRPVTMYDFIRKYGFDKESIYRDRMFFDPNNGELLCRSCHAKEHRTRHN